jgi:phosphatidate cytidylyltransferase
VLLVVVAALVFGAIEYFDKVSEKGYRPATIIGIISCVRPRSRLLGWRAGLPLISRWASSPRDHVHRREEPRSAPMPNMAITTLGVVWIGFLGSFAALILRFSKGSGSRSPPDS